MNRNFKNIWYELIVDMNNYFNKLEIKNFWIEHKLQVKMANRSIC